MRQRLGNAFKACMQFQSTVDALSEIIAPVVYALGLGAFGGFVVGFAL